MSRVHRVSVQDEQVSSEVTITENKEEEKRDRVDAVSFRPCDPEDP